MNKMTKKEKFKQFVSDHAEELAVYTTMIAAVGGYVALVVAVGKQEAKQIAEYTEKLEADQKWVTEQHNANKSIYALQDGSYLLMSNDAEREWIYRP